MITVDTFFDGREIYETPDGMYFIALNGIIVSPPFATIRAAQDNAWLYAEKEDGTTSD